MQETFNIGSLKDKCRESLPLSSRDQIELMWNLREPYRWLHGIREIDGRRDHVLLAMKGLIRLFIGFSKL